MKIKKIKKLIMNKMKKLKINKKSAEEIYIKI